MELLTAARFALRQMRRRWMLTLAAALSLALCLGLNTAIFSVFNAVLLRPLPFPEPDQVVEIFNTYPSGGVDKAGSGIELYTVYKEEVEGLEATALQRGRESTVGGEDGAQRVTSLQVTPGYFDLFRLPPALGETFRAEHGDPGNAQVVVLTDSYWRAQFAANPTVVGQSLQIDGRDHTIIGVLPEAFRRYDPDAQIILPWAWNPAEIDLNRRHLNYAQLLGRLKDGVPIEVVQAQVDAIDAAYRESNPEVVGFLERAGHRSQVKRHREERIAPVRGTLYLLQLFALAVLIIGALNIANLRIAEVSSRERELTLRRVLGASRGTLLRQLLVEAGLLGLIGGALGLLTAWFSLSLMRKSFAGVIRDLDGIQLDGTVLLWSCLHIAVTILIVGLYPAKLLRRLHFQTLLQEGGRGSASGRGAILRTSLGVIQTALAVLLLVATGLFVRSFWNATAVDPGFDAGKLHTFRLSLASESRYPDDDARIATTRQVLAELRALPGVEAAAATSAVPVIMGRGYLTISVKGEDLSGAQEQKAADNFQITEDYFETLGIPLLGGRGIEITDTAESPEVFVVDQRLTQRWLEHGAVGANLTFGGIPENDDEWPTVVGEAPNTLVRQLTNLDRAPVVYRSYYRNPPQNVSFVVRSDRDHASILADARQIVQRLDPQLPLYFTGRLDEMINDSLQERRGILGLTLLFAVVAMLLALAGIYGVHAYNIQAERRTIAIRAAIGATPGAILQRTLVRGMIPVATGLVLGLGIGLAFSPQIMDLLFEVPPRDPLTFALATVLVLGISTLALFGPALVASRTNPGKILHES
jgi:predicted permease